MSSSGETNTNFSAMVYQDSGRNKSANNMGENCQKQVINTNFRYRRAKNYIIANLKNAKKGINIKMA